MNLFNFIRNTADDQTAGSYWFKTLVALTLITATAYMLLHIDQLHLVNNPGNKRIEYLDKDQAETLNRLMDKPMDKLHEDSIRKNIRYYFIYLYSNFDMRDNASLEKIIKEFSLSDLKVVLPKYPIQLRSYFWLYQNWVYFEIIFWCLFGVLANLLYNSTEKLRKGDFIKEEIYAQLAKLIYSPFCVVIIYICYDKLQSSNSQYNIQYSIYSIVISFLLGFFSGRMIELLSRLKDLLLPSQNPAADSDDNDNGSTASDNESNKSGVVTDNSINKSTQAVG